MGDPISVNISEETFLPVYRHLLAPADYDIDFLYGGRDSGKSRHIAMQLVIDCMQLPYFRCILTRKVANTIKESQWQLIKDVVEEWGLDKFFTFNVNPLEIKCINGNRFFCRGLDEPARLKSVANPSHCWVEEGNQISAEDFVIILTSLRYNGGRTKTWFSFNPECEGNYTEFWLYQEYFSHTSSLSFSHVKKIELSEDEVLYYRTRATHSTYKNNPYCSANRKALYESYKDSVNNQYWYQTFTLGLWGYRRSGGAYWKGFDEAKHIYDVSYNPEMTVHVSVDNNRLPYITISLWQIDVHRKRIIQIGELPCVAPDNTARKAALRLAEWLELNNYKDVLYLYGDPSSKARSTIDDDSRSFFDVFIAALTSKKVTIENRIGNKAARVGRGKSPTTTTRGEFINEIYEKEYAGWSIAISAACRTSIEDYMMVKEDKDGSLMKKRETHKETGQSFERYGHFSDAKSYLITTVLADEFFKYKSRHRKMPLSISR